MSGFFKPLRRKIGIVTLALACLFAAGWVRTFSTTDSFDLFGGLYSCGTSAGTFYCIRMNPADPSSPISPPKMSADRTSLFRRLGFMEIEIRIGSGGGVTAIGKGTSFPYWLVTAPQTLVSAWLLLSQPRKPKLFENFA